MIYWTRPRLVVSVFQYVTELLMIRIEVPAVNELKGCFCREIPALLLAMGVKVAEKRKKIEDAGKIW